MNINKKYLKSHNCFKGQNKPQYIIIHETDNEDYGAGAERHALAQYNGNIGDASVHFYVDDKEVYQCLELEDGSWNCGDKYNPQINNRNTISIEICVNPDSDYNKAVQNAIELSRYLLKLYSWGVDHLTTHTLATGKYCPRRILDRELWSWFVNQVEGKEIVKPSAPIVENKGGCKVYEIVKNSPVVYGSRGNHVYLMQSMLKVRGIYTGIIDGDAGNNTLVAIQWYNNNYGLANGNPNSFGPGCWKHIFTN